MTDWIELKHMQVKPVCKYKNKIIVIAKTPSWVSIIFADNLEELDERNLPGEPIFTLSEDYLFTDSYGRKDKPTFMSDGNDYYHKNEQTFIYNGRHYSDTDYINFKTKSLIRSINCLNHTSISENRWGTNEVNAYTDLVAKELYQPLKTLVTKMILCYKDRVLKK